jgi:hypothetical protein
VELFHFLTSGTVVSSSATDVRGLVRSGQAECVPISLTQIPYLTANGRIRTDVAFVQVSPPDSHSTQTRRCSILPNVLDPSTYIVTRMEYPM